MAWYDDSNSFVAGFMDGVICLAKKHQEEKIKILEAHKVSSVVLYIALNTTKVDVTTLRILIPSHSYH